MQEALTSLLDNYRSRFTQVLATHPALAQSLARDDAALTGQLERVWTGSDYAASVCLETPDILQNLLTSGDLQRNYADWSAHLEQCVTQAGIELADVSERLKKQLRWFRKREYLRIMWRDLVGTSPLMDTTRDLSLLADSCLHYALRELTPVCHALYGLPLDAQGHEQQMIVLAMGKYGAYELNLSSDIDLVLVFPEGGETTLTPEFKQQHPRAQQVTIQQYFCKLGQLLNAVLDTTTADGFVFRVDLRLRPYGSAGALALPVDAMEEYYLTQGRDWERFAMIKARAVTGDPGPIAELMQVLRSFTYRRYLDFATIESLRALKLQIEQQVRRKGLHNNIKLGRGGIREIEFIVQVLQLIFGGRHVHLQCNSLLLAMQGLVQEGCLPAADASALEDSYYFLRRLEHTIQGLEDKQTHLYPDDALSELRCAIVLGFADAQALRTSLESVRDTVASLFAQLITDSSGDKQDRVDKDLAQVWCGGLDDDKALELLEDKGFTDARELLRTIVAYRNSRQGVALDTISRERMDCFMPLLLTRLMQEAAPEFTFLRIFPFVQAVAQRSVYLMLLLENPLALDQLIHLGTVSPWVMEQLCRYPVLLDELLRPLSQPPGLAALQDTLQRQLLRIPESALDELLGAIQLFKQEQILTVAAAELSGTLPLMRVSDALSWIAETVLQQIMLLAWQQLAGKFGMPVNANGESGQMEFIIIAYGKLGGIELNYGSDLDLVFMHDADPDRDTTGGESGLTLSSSAFYVQLGQKILSMLNTHTMTGKLYEIDMRLRPSGASGALVSNLAAFKQYQEQDAWTWEYQALVRARVVAGSQALAGRFASLRTAILGTERDAVKLQQDIVSMRHKMRKQLGSRPEQQQFRLKQDAGGLVDIEFIVQYLVLRYGKAHAELLQWPDNMRLLDEAIAAGVLPEKDARSLQEIYIEYRTLLHRHALDKQPYVLGPQDYAGQRELVTAVWHRLFAGIEPGELHKGQKEQTGHSPA